MPGKGTNNKVSPRLPKEQKNFQSAHGEKYEENMKRPKNGNIESLEIETQKEITETNNKTETCEENPTEADDNEMIESINETNAGDGRPKDLPPTCKSCFIAFAEKKSPACNHQFCLKCYKKLEKQVCHNVILLRIFRLKSY